MIEIRNYIFEKLQLNKNTAVAKDVFDKTNEQMLIDLIKSTFIYIYRDRVYRAVNMRTYVINRSKIDYTEIIKILNEEYYYGLDPNEITDKKGDLYRFIHKHLDSFDKLINFKMISFHAVDSTNIITLSGNEIYWNDWKAYREKYHLTGY